MQRSTRMTSIILLLWFLLGSYACLGFDNGVDCAAEYRADSTVVFAHNAHHDHQQAVTTCQTAEHHTGASAQPVLINPVPEPVISFLAHQRCYKRRTRPPDITKGQLSLALMR